MTLDIELWLYITTESFDKKGFLTMYSAATLLLEATLLQMFQ